MWQPLPPTMRSHATQVILLLAFLEWCSVFCLLKGWHQQLGQGEVTGNMCYYGWRVFERVHGISNGPF
jgi:hypothetical protein